MSQGGGSNAGWDTRSRRSSRRDDHDSAPPPYRAPSDRGNGSITSHSRREIIASDGGSRTFVSVTSKRREGPPISMHARYSSNGGLSPHAGSESRGSIRAPSVTSRTLQRNGESRHGSVTSKRSESVDSVDSDGTARPDPKHGTHGRDTDLDRESYTSGRRSHASGRESHASDRRSHASGRESHTSGRRSHAPSEASEHTLRSDVEELSKQAGSLNLGPQDAKHERVKRWNEQVNRDTKGDRWDGDPTTGLRSDSEEDHHGEGTNAPSHHKYPKIREPRSHTSSSYVPPPPESYAARFPPSGTGSHTSKDLAFQEYRDTYAPSRNRTHKSRDLAPKEYHDTYDPYTSRNPPLSYGRGTYVDGHDNIGRVDNRSVYVTQINGPDMSFMNEPSKGEKNRMRKHELRMSRGKSRRDDSESDSDW
ncbi:hypothetical protein EAE96_007337 [Botrytis aclada]|nr:hypothetical protein EAE96_007337 [Botrytis aclada]